MKEENLDTLIRDITKVGSIPKSEVKRRLKDIIKAEHRDIIGEIDNDLKKYQCGRHIKLHKKLNKYIGK